MQRLKLRRNFFGKYVCRHFEDTGMTSHSPQTFCKHWLVFRLGHLGDVVLTTGVLAKLHKEYGWTFTYVAKKPWADIFIGNPHVQKVISLEPADLGTRAFFAFSRRIATEYKGCGLLDLHRSLRSRILSAFWRGPVLRYPKMSLERRLFLKTKGSLCREALRRASVPQRYFMAVSPDFPQPVELLPHIWLSEEERAAARERLDVLLGPGTAPVALHPFATHSLKTWPAQSWLGLARLLDQKAVPWLVLGVGESPFEGQGRDLSNRSSLRESCALLSHCRALVSGDSGPMHLAAAVGTPVIALFGPTTREWGFYPAGMQDRVLETELNCRPCSLHGLASCPRDGACLTGITPENVLKILEPSE